MQLMAAFLCLPHIYINATSSNNESKYPSVYDRGHNYQREELFFSRYFFVFQIIKVIYKKGTMHETTKNVNDKVTTNLEDKVRKYLKTEK